VASLVISRVSKTGFGIFLAHLVCLKSEKSEMPGNFQVHDSYVSGITLTKVWFAVHQGNRKNNRTVFKGALKNEIHTPLFYFSKSLIISFSFCYKLFISAHVQKKYFYFSFGFSLSFATVNFVFLLLLPGSF
jgi:hypothetical protein